MGQIPILKTNLQKSFPSKAAASHCKPPTTTTTASPAPWPERGPKQKIHRIEKKIHSIWTRAAAPYRTLITASSDQLWVGRSVGWKSTTSREGRKKASKIRYFDDCFLLQQFRQGMREQEAGKCGRKFSVNTTHHAAFATTIIASPPPKILNSIAYFDR